jgi:hypothetical protein
MGQFPLLLSAIWYCWFVKMDQGVTLFNILSGSASDLLEPRFRVINQSEQLVSLEL